MTTIKLNSTQKKTLVAFVKDIEASAKTAREAGVAIMATLAKVSKAFPDVTATALASLLMEHGMTYSPVTIGIYIGTIRKADAKGKNITGMTNTEAMLALSDGNSNGKGKAEPDKDALLAKLKKLAKAAQKAGASLEDICESIGLELA
jgi:hypothetical protein